jgi:hypothetical protein
MVIEYIIDLLKEVNSREHFTKKQIKNFYYNILCHEYLHSKIYHNFSVFHSIEIRYYYNPKKYHWRAKCIAEYDLEYILPKNYPKYLFIEFIQYFYDFLFDLFYQFTFHKYFFYRLKRFFQGQILTLKYFIKEYKKVRMSYIYRKKAGK